MQAFGRLLGLLAGGAAAFSPDEAQAAPRPKYMEELVNKLKRRDYTPMDFGTISGGHSKSCSGSIRPLPKGRSSCRERI